MPQAPRDLEPVFGEPQVSPGSGILSRGACQVPGDEAQTTPRPAYGCGAQGAIRLEGRAREATLVCFMVSSQGPGGGWAVTVLDDLYLSVSRMGQDGVVAAP